METILQGIRNELKKAVDEKVKSSFGRFFKEEVRYYGVSMPKTQKIATKAFYKIKDSGRRKIFGLIENLFKSGYCEEVMVGAHFAYLINKEYEPSDIFVFESWIDKYIDNWAECDTFCNHAVGALIERYPDRIVQLKKWARSKNLWKRRAAAVTLIVPSRRGKFIKDIFDIADILIVDEEDLVRKGYGWMLKAASQAYPAAVFDYVMKNKNIMPRTALRYAIEKLPGQLKSRAVKK